MREYRDRITKGAEIARLNHVHQHESGFAIESDSNPMNFYHVTAERANCTCPDFAKNISICKHLWATAAPLALTILEIREAATVDDLDRLFDEGRERARDLPRGFELAMRHDYARAYCRVQEEIDLKKAAARLNARAQVDASQSRPAARITEASA